MPDPTRGRHAMRVREKIAGLVNEHLLTGRQRAAARIGRPSPAMYDELTEKLRKVQRGPSDRFLLGVVSGAFLALWVIVGASLVQKWRVVHVDARPADVAFALLRDEWGYVLVLSVFAAVSAAGLVYAIFSRGFVRPEIGPEGIFASANAFPVPTPGAPRAVPFELRAKGTLLDRLRSRQLPTLMFSLSPAVVRLGEELRVRWRLEGGGDLRSLQVVLLGTERATITRMRRGDDYISHSRVTSTNVFATLPLVDQQSPVERSGDASMSLPPDTMHSFDGTSNHVEWSLRVRCLAPSGKVSEDDFPVRVAPAGARA